MFLTLVIFRLIVSFAASWLVVRVFNKPIESLLNSIVPNGASRGWSRFIIFAIYVIGLSRGVRLSELREYIPQSEFADGWFEGPFLPRSIFEFCNTAFESLYGIVWFLFYFFLVALIALALAKLLESKDRQPPETSGRA